MEALEFPVAKYGCKCCWFRFDLAGLRKRCITMVCMTNGQVRWFPEATTESEDMYLAGRSHAS